MPPNPYLLAADNNPALLPLLRSDPTLAAGQDEHGYSLVHAAASYNHLDLLRMLVREFRVPVDLRDEDGETALFVVETIEAARCLVEELNLDVYIRGAEGLTAREKIEGEGDFPEVAAYLRVMEARAGDNTAVVNGTSEGIIATEAPLVPDGLAVTVGAMSEAVEVPGEPDPEFRRRIEQLAARGDFHTGQGQAELRRLVEDAVYGQGLAEDRNVRPRQD